MIAVDIFADLYEWDDKQRERGHRAAGAAKTLYTLARVGRSGASPLIFVEAALAVLDAVGAYASYRQAKEITHQLEIEADMLRDLLMELHERLRIGAKVANEKYEAKLSNLRARLEQQELDIQIDEERLDSLSRQVKKLGNAIARLRLDSPPNCGTLLRLESAYYNLVDAQLKTAMDLVKE
jgi:polyhydroxyalkanoate synthesis regulator phasin